MQMHPAKKVVLARLACVAIAAMAMFFLIRRIQPEALAEAFRAVRPSWFLAATLLYGGLFVPAAWRWHLALRLTDSAVNFGTSLRLSLIGHFFYTIFFGAAGGDVAKSALYARRHDLPLPPVLASSSLDRLLGFGGLILFLILTFGIAAAHGGLFPLRTISPRWPGVWLALVIVAGALALWLTRSRFETAWRQFFSAFLTSVKRLTASPKNLVAGIVCGFAVQLALSGALALNLQAVSRTPIPWMQLAWTFPIISVISALPITVAGLGVRDSAAFALLGLCNVAGPDAVAASLMTACASLLWTIIGGMLLWREERGKQPVREARKVAAEMPGLS
jgi:glycosyltransferase 2 family protein